MRWIYISLAVIGFIVPALVLYVVQQEQRAPGTPVDLGLLLFSLGVGLLFSPLSVAAGLAMAAAIHWLWNWAQPRRR